MKKYLLILKNQQLNPKKTRDTKTRNFYKTPAFLNTLVIFHAQFIRSAPSGIDVTTIRLSRVACRANKHWELFTALIQGSLYPHLPIAPWYPPELVVMRKRQSIAILSQRAYSFAFNIMYPK